MAKSNFIVRGGANFNPLYQEFNKAQKKMTAFQSGISKSLKGLAGVLSVAMGVAFVKSTTKMAMAVESATDNIKRNMGASAKAFQIFADTQSRAHGEGRRL